MGNEVNKTQVNVLLSPTAERTLRVLREAKEQEVGLAVSMSAFVEMLVMQEAKRQGVAESTKKRRKP